MKRTHFAALMATVIAAVGMSAVSVTAKEVNESIPYETSFDMVGEGAAQRIADGLCGENVTYALSSDGVLTISGSGRMADYDYYSSPFYEYQEQIKYVVIEEGVTYIGKYVFYEIVGLKEVMLSKSVKEIGESAFSDCYGLTNVTLKEGLENIGNLAFSGCSGLAKIELPVSLKSIGDSAFSYSGLKNIYIPKDVEYIGVAAFGGVTMDTMEIDAENQNYTYESQILYNKEKTHIVGANGGIGKNVTISETVTSIGNAAFSGCSNLKTISIPNTVATIGESAFSYSGLTSITIPEGITRIEAFTFAGCSNLKEVLFSENITDIGERAFYFATALESVVLPESVERIETAAFYSCSSMIAIQLPTSMTSIGNKAFSSCQSLEKITIPKGITCLEEQAFGGCRKLRTVVLPNTLTSIEKEVFTQCNGLSEIMIPESVTNIGNGAFAYCSSLTNVVIPDGVTSLGETVFRECDALEMVTIPKSVTSIDKTLFYLIEHDVIIAGEAGSYAQTFANEIKMPFMLLDGTMIQPTCTITYDANGGVVGEQSRTVNKRTPIGKHPVATREGYILKGWYLYRTGGTKISEDMIVMSDQTLYAVWEEVVSDTANNGTGDSNNTGSNNSATNENSNSNGNKNEKDTSDNTGSSMNKVEVNKVYTVDKYKYKVLNDSEVAFAGLKSNKTKKVTIPKTVTIKGKKFKVTTIISKSLRKKNITHLEIGANVKWIESKAFENCKKLKKITIKSTQIKSVGKSAFKGIPKTAQVKVPKKKLDSYKKMLKKAGLNKKVKVKR